MKKPTHKSRFKLNKKEKFMVMMKEDTFKIMRKQFISFKSKPYSFAEDWRLVNNKQVKKIYR